MVRVLKGIDLCNIDGKTTALPLSLSSSRLISNVYDERKKCEMSGYIFGVGMGRRGQNFGVRVW